MKAEIRKHYFLDKYVIITPARAKRPRRTGQPQKLVNIEDPDCPFCFDKVEKKLLIKGYPSFKNPQYFVLKNKYPIVTPDNQKAYGWHELISETPDHFQDLSAVSISHMIGLLNVYKDRIKTISQMKEIDYLLVLKNHGLAAGASRPHAHSQILGLKMLPPLVQEELEILTKNQQTKQDCLYCQILQKETRGPRRIFVNKEIIAFCPYASEYHYEAWILPRRHVASLIDLTERETIVFAKVLKRILRKIFKLRLAYNFFFHHLVKKNKDWHFYFKIQPRQSIWAGVEMGTGMVVNSLAPEKAAEFYRQ
ncbi:MAG: DUF4931 domain-containing protein [Patescibacteria group bacterium]|nr:DUF4931 domain-containing protein [Patescibacteria group bacterium]